MMTNIIKKSLACGLALVFCLTCMIGALTVNAAEATLNGSFDIENATAVVGDETVDVKVTITAESNTINELYMIVDAGDAGKVVGATSEDAEAYYFEGYKAIGVSKKEAEDTEVTGYTTAVVTVKIQLNEGLEAGDYPVSVALSDRAAASPDEGLYAFTPDEAIISVVEAAAEGLTAETVVTGSLKNYQLVFQVNEFVWNEDAENKVVAVGILAVAADKAPTEIVYGAEGVYSFEHTLGATEAFATVIPYIVVNGLSFDKMLYDYSFVPYIELADGSFEYAPVENACIADYFLEKYTTNARAKAYIDAYYTMKDNSEFAEIATKYTAVDNTKTYTKAYDEKTYGSQEETALVANSFATGSPKNFQFVCQVNNLQYKEDVNNKVVSMGIVALDSTKYVSGDVTLETEGVYSYEHVFTGSESFSSMAASGLYISINGLTLDNITKDYIFVPFIKLEDETYVYAKSVAYCFADFFIDTGLKNSNANTAARSNGFLDAYYQKTGTALYTAE